MAYGTESTFPQRNQYASRPVITSYDSGYDFSMEHYVDTKLLLQDAENEANKLATYALGS
jgi:hypothetical protein